MGLKELFNQIGGQAEQLLNQQAQEIAALRAELAQLRQAFDILRSNVHTVFDDPAVDSSGSPHRQPTKLEAAIGMHEKRIDKLNQEMTRQRSDLVPADQLIHRDIAQKLDVFVTQDLFGAASVLTSNPGEHAYIISRLSQLFFDRQYHGCASDKLVADLHNDQIGISSVDFERLRAGAEVLQAQANATKDGHSWTVSAQLNVPVDETYQQVWEDNDPDGIVSRIVAPGYHVGDKVYSRQYVLALPVQAETSSGAEASSYDAGESQRGPRKKATGRVAPHPRSDPADHRPAGR